MPYTTDNLPSNVKKLSPKAQRQWMHVANSCISDGKDDGACIRMANGVVKKSKAWDEPLTTEEATAIAGEKYSQYVESWDVADRALSQAEAGYNPLGATDAQGCANCQWFLPPGRCVVVAGDISPTGLSALWRAKAEYSMPPIPVFVVDEPTVGARESDGPSATPPSLVGTFKALITTVSKPFSGGPARASAEAGVKGDASGYMLVKQKDGRVRFFAVWSNNFVDREKEVFPEYAHREFVDFAEREKAYPELWLWHTPGTRYGQVDWLDVTSGFACASGLIDEGKEVLAETIAKEDTGVSHGFVGYQKGNEIVWYRSHEISTLPRQNAAVWTTSFNLLTEGEKEMPFTTVRKDFLKAHGFSDVKIAELEQNAAKLSGTLKDLGIAYKDDGFEDPTPPPTPPAPDPAPAPPPAAAEPTAADKALNDILAATSRTEALVAGLAEVIKAQDARIKAVEGGVEAGVAAAITPRVTPGAAGVAASASAGNIVDTKAVGSSDNEFIKKHFLDPLSALGVDTGNGVVVPPVTT